MLIQTKIAVFAVFTLTDCLILLRACAGLLNLAPNSKEAQVFEQYAKQAAAQGTTASPTAGQFRQHQLLLALFPVRFLHISCQKPGLPLASLDYLCSTVH